MLQLFTDNIEDMCNCLKMPTSQFRKLLSTLFVFIALCVSAQAETYYWIGGGTDNNWTTVENWSTTEGATPGTGTSSPGSDDIVHIYGDVDVILDSEISIGQLLIEATPSYYLGTSFTSSLSGTGPLNITGIDGLAINLTRCSGTNDVIGTLEINIPVTCAGDIQTHSGTTLLVANDVTLSAANLIHSAGSGNPISKIQIEGTLDIETGTLNLNGNNNNGATQLVVGTNGIVKTGIIKFDKTVYSNTSSNGTTTKITDPIINNGIIQFSNSFTIPNFTSGVTTPYSGSGSIVLNGNDAKFINEDNIEITIAKLTGGTDSSTVTGGGYTKITTATFNGTATVEDCEIATATFNNTVDISDSTITNATFHDDITLSGENTFTNFTAIGLGGNTLTVDAEQTIQSGGSITLSGTDSSNLLGVEGSGKFTLGTVVLSGDYLSLDTDSNVTSASTGTIFAQNSQTTGSGTTNWIVTSAGGHLWNGENGDWEEVSNWIPQTALNASDEIIINSDTPKINTAVAVKSITLNGGGISLLSGSLTLESITLAADTSVSTAADTSITITEDWALDNKITGAGKLILDAGKDFTIADGTTIDINVENNGNLTSSGAVIFNKSFKDTGSFTGTITISGNGNQSFTPKSSTTYSEINVIKDSGTFSVTGDLNVTKLTLDSEEISITGNLTTGNGTQFTGNNQITSTEDISFTKALDAGDNLTVSASGDVSFAEDFTSDGDLSITATTNAVSFTGQCNISGDFSVTSNTLTFGDSVSVKDFTINATTTTSSDITVRGNWTNSGSFTADAGTVILTTVSSDTSRVTLSGTNTFHNLNLDRNVSILGSNTINQDLIMHRNSGDAAGKGNIYFAAGTKQTINGKIDFKGLTSKRLLAACGNASGTTNGTWEIEYGTAEVQNVNLSGCKNSSTQAIVITDSAGTDANGKSVDGGGNTNFIFLGHSYTWNGGTSTNWNTADNWSPSSIPGKGSEITLPAGKTNYPVLAAELDLIYDATYKGSILIEDGASFDLAGENLTVGAITNNGKVRLTGAETITASMSNDTNTNSTVEYYDTTSTLSTFVWDGGNATTPSYNNLIILKPVSSTQKISVSGTVKIGNTDETSPTNNINAGSVTLKSDSPITLEDNVFAEFLDFVCEAKIKNIKVTDSVIFEKSVTLLSNSKITSAAGDKIHFKDTVTGASFNLTTETGNSQFDGDINIGSLTTKAATINCSNIETSSNGQTFDGAVSVLKNVILKAPENKLIHFKDTVSGSSSVDLTIDTANSQFDGDVNIGSLSTKTATINCSNIETSSSGQTFDGTVTLQNNVTFKAPASQLIHFKNTVSGTGTVNLTTDTGNSQFDGEISNLVSLSTAATAIFKNNINIVSLTTQKATVNANCDSITTSGNQIFNDLLTLEKDLSLIASTSGKEIDFANNISASGKTLTINTPIFKSTASSDNNITADKIVFASSTTSIQSTAAELTFAVPEIDGSGEIKLESNGSTIYFTGNVNLNPKVTTATGTSFKASSGSMTFNNDVNFANNTLTANNGTIILTRGTLSGNNTFYNLKLEDSVTISGSNTITNLTADRTGGLGGKTITFAAGSEQIISGKLSLKGSDSTEGNRLLLRSSTSGNPWVIKCTGTNEHDIKFVDIEDSNNTSTAYYLFALNSFDHGNNTKWNFPGMQYVWTGADSTDPTNWDKAANWNTLSVPGKGADITIPELTSASPKYPKLIAELNLNDSYGSPAVDYKGIITIAANATFDLADQKLTADEIINYGLVRLTGASDQTISGKMINEEASTVEYYGTGTTPTNFAWGGDNGAGTSGQQYANLILNQATSGNTELTVSETLTINEAANLSGKLSVTGTTSIKAASNKIVILNNAANTFTGNVILGTSTTSTGDITLKAGELISIADNANSVNLTVESAVQPGNKITTSGNQTYNGQVQINVDSVLTAPNNKQIIFNGELTGSAKLKTEGDAVAHFNGNVNNLGELETQTATLNCSTLSTTGKQTYNGAVEVTTAGANGATLTSGGNITFNELVSGNAKLKTSGNGISYFNNTVQIGSLETQTTHINCTSIETTNEGQIYNGEVTLENGVTLTAPSTKLIIFKDIVHGLNGTEALQINTANSQFDEEVSSLATLTTVASTTFKNNINIGSLTTQKATVNTNCASITTSGNQIFNDVLTLEKDLTLIASTNGKEIDFANDISASGKNLTINTPRFKSIATLANTITADNIVFAASTTSIQSASAELTFAVPEIDGNGEIKLEETGSRITFTGNVNVNPKVTTTTGTTFKASSSSMTFNNDVNFANNTLTANNGTIILTRGTLSGNNTFYNLKLEESVTISGSNTITNLTADRTDGLGGKTITFAAGSEQIVNGLLILKGSSETDKLTLCSSTPSSQWKIKCTGANNHVIQYVDVQDSLNESETGSPTAAYNLFALNSWDNGNNTNWNFPRMHYLWKTNATSTDWNTATNWVQNSIPGKGALVTIQAPADNNAKQPILTSNLDLKDTFKGTDYDGELLVSSGASLDLSGNNLTVGTITNNGLIRLTGASGQIIDSSMSNRLNSTVEYYGTSTTTTNFAWDGDNGAGTPGKQYANLILNQATSGNTQLTVSETLTINEAANLTGELSVTETTTIKAASNKAVTLNNAANTFTGNVILGTSTTPTGNITLKAGTIFTIADNVNAASLAVESAVKLQNVKTNGSQTYSGSVEIISGTATLESESGSSIDFGSAATINGAQELTLSSTGDITLGANVGTTTPLSALNVTGPLNINCADIKTSGNQTYNQITLNSDATFTVSGSDKKINFNGAISGSKKLTSAGSGTANFNNTVNIESLETQAAKINSFSITTSNNQLYNGPVTLAFASRTDLKATAGNITFASTLTGNQLHIVQANNTTFSDAIDISSFSDDSTNHQGTVTFLAGGTIRNAVTFNTNNTVSINGTMNIGAASPRKDLTHTAGNTTINGTVNAANINLSNITTNGDITATTTQIENITLTGNTIVSTTGTQTYNGPVNDSSTGSHTLTLNSGTAQITLTSTAAIGQTTAPKSLEVNGPLTIEVCPSIKTSVSQIYNSAISSSGSIELESACINLNAGTVTTIGSQNYKGTVVLESDNTLSSDADIHFNSTLTGNYKLTLSKANNTTFDDSVTIAGFTDTANSGNITFKNGGNITNSNGISFLTTGLVTFGDNQTDTMTFGTTSSYADLTHTAGNTSITGTLKAANITLAETSGGPITITNSGLLKTEDNKALSYTTHFNQNGSGNSKLGGSFTGNGPATFASSLQFYGSTVSNFGNAGTNISISKNLIITRESTDPLTILSNVNISDHLVLYKGPVTLNANITTGKDILILGSSYSENDTSTNIADEYAYTTPRHEEWSQPSYSETTLPDGSNLPETYTATLTVGTNCILTTGKNFYANGTSLTIADSSGQWLLKLPDLTNPANGFAETYHSVVSGCKVVCNAGTNEADTDGSKARLATLECTDAGSDDTPNTNIEFDDFEIVNAYTVRDNAIRIEFNRPIRYHASIINSLKFHSASSLPDCDFSAFYSTPDCTEESELKSDITMSYFNEDDNKTYYYFYIKASAQNNTNLGAWNTDATSKAAGHSEKSSDRNGVHHDTLPCLDFPRSLKNDDGTTLSFIFTDIWGQRLKNYSLRPDPLALEPAYGSDASSYEVLDKTGPVLWTLRSGQENHDAYDSSKGESSQHSYDAHNFIEFRYSEPVNFGSADTSICDINIPAFTDDTNTEINLAENIQVTDIFGAVQEDITTYQNTMTFAGLAKITATGSSLCLHTGTEGKASKYMNALYRTDEYSLRLSISGWTDSTVADYNGNLYKNWSGYIEEASQFTGSKASAVAETNPLVCDLNGNIQIEYPVSPTEPLILSNADNLLFTPDPDIYGQWDLSSPVFAPLRFNAKLAWSDCPDTDTSEAVGNTNGSGSTLDRIEFHFFDNTPLYNNQDPAEWFTEVGWCNPGSNPTRENLKDPSYTYASDIIGGARQFDTDNKRRTSGGVRFSTKVTSAAGFLYSKNASNMNPQTPFKEGIENVHTSTTSPLFTGSSSPRHPVNDPDSLYLGIGITDSNLPVESTFSFAYSDTKAYVTDLAGNRLRSKVSKTIDRTPPSFDIVLSPVGNNEMFIIFVKQIVTDSAELRLTSNEGEVIQISEDFMSLLPDCFQIISIDQDGNYSPSEEIKIDTSVPARLIPSHTRENFTTVRLALTQNVSIENVKNLYIQLKQNSNYPETSQDPFTSNKNSNVTLIQDSLGNYMGMYSAHALSDFAINSVTPLYAYASDMQYNDENVMEGLYGQGSWAVHDWNEDQQNYGTLPYGYDTQLVAQSSGSDPMRLYLSEKPDAESVASQFNEDFSTKLRIWLPEVKDGIFSALTSSNNKNYVSSDSTYLNNENSENLSFYISADTIKKWSPGDQVSFIFGLLDASENPYRIYDSPYYDVGSGLYNLSLNNPVPLYCFRMHNPSDISTIDLWSFRLKDITNQRGGITILNNVINADLGEKTVLKVNMPTDGNLNIAVLTLDGNIITYLNKGRLSEGEHWFTWNGKNRNGTSVARGMYFIRISGSGIDETRKVMVVK